MVRERPFYSDKARTNGWRWRGGGEGPRSLGSLGAKKREGKERLFDTEDKLRVAFLSVTRTKKCFESTLQKMLGCFRGDSELSTLSQIRHSEVMQYLSAGQLGLKAAGDTRSDGKNVTREVRVAAVCPHFRNGKGSRGLKAKRCVKRYLG